MHFSNTSYLKAWTWLLPCWIWRVFFEQLGKRPVRLEDRLRYAVRIDDEFVLIFDPAPGQLSKGEIQTGTPPGLHSVQGLPVGLEANLNHAASSRAVLGVDGNGAKPQVSSIHFERFQS